MSHEAHEKFRESVLNQFEDNDVFVIDLYRPNQRREEIRRGNYYDVIDAMKKIKSKGPVEGESYKMSIVCPDCNSRQFDIVERRCDFCGLDSSTTNG